MKKIVNLLLYSTFFSTYIYTISLLLRCPQIHLKGSQFNDVLLFLIKVLYLARSCVFFLQVLVLETENSAIC